MIPFEIEKLEVKHVWLKSVTTALGGSISILDEDRSTEDKEVFTKIKMPMAVARAYIQLHEVRQYLAPVLAAVTFYDGHAVAIERHPEGSSGKEVTEGLFGQEHWISDSEKNVDKVVLTHTFKGDWYVDGTFIFTFSDINVAKATHLSRDGRYRSIQVNALKLANIPNRQTLGLEERTCLQYVAPDGTSAMSSPIWKTLGKVGSRQMDLVENQGKGGVVPPGPKFQFDEVDEHLCVNLAFALKAGKEISTLFGFDAIEPLQLDDLMIRLRTVNLPNVPKTIKQTHDIGLPFTHAVAWLLGLLTRIDTLDSYMILRSLMKYVTTKGVYRKNPFDPSKVYRTGFNRDMVPLKTPEQALALEGGSQFEYLHHTTGNRNRGSDGVGAIGNLHGAE